ncbi:MAG: Ribosomal small subunit methyltransferase, partial [Planctomycetota bacterium]
RIEPRDDGRLDPRDAALARAIEHAVVRRYLTLIACIRPHLTKNWPLLEKPVQAALLGGAAQILFLDRVPAAAAVDASVEWTKRRLRPGAGGLVNAVLRKVAASVAERLPACEETRALIADQTRRNIVPLSDGSALRLSIDAFSEDAAANLSERTSHARELILHWIGAFGFRETTRLALHDLSEAPIIVTTATDVRITDAHNPSISSTPSTPSTEASSDSSVEPHEERGFGVWKGSHSEMMAMLAAHPELRVQDPTSAMTVASLAPLLPRAPQLIVDLCAGRGTKTKQLAELFPNATIFATDPDDARFAALAELRHRHPGIKPLSPQSVFREAAGKADLLLLDVPCSNSGVLARRPEARYRFSKARTAAVIELQQKIADPAIGLVAPGGAVIYATCSIERAENESQVKRLASRFGLTLAVERSIMPAGLPGDSPRVYRDGGYHALLWRT